MRAFRLDKMTLAALEATLRLYLDEETALREVPVLRMLGMPLDELRQRARGAGRALASDRGVDVGRGRRGRRLRRRRLAAGPGDADVGGRGEAARPERRRLRAAAAHGDAGGDGRVRDGKLVLDVRTILPHQIDALVEAMCAAS